MKQIRFYFIGLFFAIFFLPLHADNYRIFAYDGEDYTVYLGNFTDSYDSNSIWNTYGTYGNEYSSKSIWNEFSEYGNEYNSYSPWNEYSSHPPIIVDDDWYIIDYFTCGYRASESMRKLLLFIKEHYDEVASDPSAFYDNVLDQ